MVNRRKQLNARTVFDFKMENNNGAVSRSYIENSITQQLPTEMGLLLEKEQSEQQQFTNGDALDIKSNQFVLSRPTELVDFDMLQSEGGSVNGETITV